MRQPLKERPPITESAYLLPDFAAAEKRRARRLQYAIRLLSFTAVVLVVAYAIMSAYVADRLTRPTRKELVGTPADVGLAFEAIAFRSQWDGVDLRGWWIPAPSSDRAIVIVHGRQSTRTGGDGSIMAQARGLVDAGFNVLTFDLRGHGDSADSRYSLGPWERSDVLAAIAQARAHGIGPGKIGLLGHSMGGATALLTGPESPDVAAIIADSAYARLTDLLTNELPKASGLPGFFSPGILTAGRVLYGVDVTQATPELAVPHFRPRPILFIHSESDTYVPPEQSRRLWRASGEGAEMLWTVAGPKHNRVFQDRPEEYVQRAVTFFTSNMRQAAAPAP